MPLISRESGNDQAGVRTPTPAPLIPPKPLRSAAGTSKPRRSVMELYVIRRPSAWANMEEVKAIAAKPTRVGDEMSDRVRWIRSYVVREPDGRFGTFCIYEARDGAS